MRGTGREEEDWDRESDGVEEAHRKIGIIAVGSVFGLVPDHRRRKEKGKPR